MSPTFFLQAILQLKQLKEGFLSEGINVREYRRGNQTWTIQRNWQHRVHKTKTHKRKTTQKTKTDFCINWWNIFLPTKTAMVLRIRWIYFQNENTLLILLFNLTEGTFFIDEIVEIVYPTRKRKLETILVIGRYGDWGSRRKIKSFISAA